MYIKILLVATLREFYDAKVTKIKGIKQNRRLTLMHSMISLGPVMAGSNRNFPLSVARATTADLRPFIFITLDSMANTHDEQVMPPICVQGNNRPV